jgi:hypothetical protein
MYAVVGTDGLPAPTALPPGNCRCGAALDLSLAGAGACITCSACECDMHLVRSRPAAAPVLRDGLPEPWANAIRAFWTTRDLLVCMTVCQGAGSVAAFASVPALTLIFMGMQLLLWLVFLGSQAAALNTPDRAARRAVVGSLTFSFGGIVVGAVTAFYLGPFYGLLAGLALNLIGYMYWIAYFNQLGVALRARELSERAVRYTSATVLMVLLSVVVAIMLGDNTPPKQVVDPFQPGIVRVEQPPPNRAANARIHVVQLALSIWFLVAYTELIRVAEWAIRERARAGTLPG